jgi:hypothetical protein
MKHFTFFLTAVLFAIGTNAQTAIEDSVNLGASYANSIFYQLDGGSKTSADNSNWDLALVANGFGTTIRINGSSGTELYAYPNGDTSVWTSVDTSGIGSWEQLNNSDANWNYGAFDAAAGSDPFDVGWGIYSVQTHFIIGHKIFIIKLSDGTYQKLWIKSLISGEYVLRHGSLDGVMDMTHSVAKADFSGKNFGYFSLQDHSTVDREPANTNWDFVVQRYRGDLGGGTYYPVTGVLTNEGVYATEARNVDVTMANHLDYDSDSLINTIGYDWKDFDMNAFVFVIEEDLSYFVTDVQGNIWHLLFTGFAGQSSGKVWFSKTLISATGINDVKKEINVAVYPNPSTDGNVSLVFNLEEEEAIARVYNMTGKLVANHTFQGQGFKQRNLNLHGLPAGTYLLRLQTAQHVTTNKIILK